MNNPQRPDKAPRARTWPLYVLAVPAGVAVWSGWVGLGELTGFGVVHPLPGIADGFSINSAITLPIGVEAYAAYALGAWLSPRPLAPAARRFAKASAIGSLILGAAGQIAYHLLEVWGRTKAPWWVTMIVACLPVLVLGMGAALAHLIHRDGRPADSEPAGTEQASSDQFGSVQNGSEPNTPAGPNQVIPAPKIHTGPAPFELRFRTRPEHGVPPSPNSAEPEPDTPPAEPELEPATELTGRAAKKHSEVQQVIGMIAEFGREAVDIAQVQNRLGLARTTAYGRLTEARGMWDRGVRPDGHQEAIRTGTGT